MTEKQLIAIVFILKLINYHIPKLHIVSLLFLLNLLNLYYRNISYLQFEQAQSFLSILSEKNF